MKTVSQVTDPLVLRRVPVGSIPLDVALVPAERIGRGWRALIEGRWFDVAGSSEDADGAVQLLIVPIDATPTRRRPVACPSLATVPRGYRLWTRGPHDGDLQTLGCVREDCPEPGPYELTDEGLLCATHLNALLAMIHDYVFQGDDDA